MKTIQTLALLSVVRGNKTLPEVIQSIAHGIVARKPSTAGKNGVGGMQFIAQIRAEKLGTSDNARAVVAAVNVLETQGIALGLRIFNGDNLPSTAADDLTNAAMAAANAVTASAKAARADKKAEKMKAAALVGNTPELAAEGTVTLDAPDDVQILTAAGEITGIQIGAVVLTMDYLRTVAEEQKARMISKLVA